MLWLHKMTLKMLWPVTMIGSTRVRVCKLFWGFIQIANLRVCQFSNFLSHSVDMPGVASATDRKIITDAVAKLQHQYGEMFSPSQRCRVPNVNVDNLRNAVYGANILKRHKLSTSKQLLDWLLVQNAALGEEYANDEEKREFVKAKSWKKANSNDFYLGLESSWLYRWRPGFT